MVSILKKILKFLARSILWRYEPDVVAITGSVGKTSTKEAIFSVLANAKIKGRSLATRKSKGNLNNEMGVPLAIIANWREEWLKLVSREQPPKTKKFKKAVFWTDAIVSGLAKAFFPFKLYYPKILVLEFGADRPMDIKYLTKIARPTIAVVTAVGDTPVHLEYYENAESVAKEKGRLVESLRVSGKAILNADDPLVLAMKEKTKANVITFGFSENADVRLDGYIIRQKDKKLEGISFKVEYEGSLVPVNLRDVLGRSQAYACGAAFAVGLQYGLNLVEIEGLLERYYRPEKHRMNLLEGIKGTQIIDDCYNASPLSMQSALETLGAVEAERKVAVLGDMLELGPKSLEAHEEIGRYAAQVADVIVTVGPRGRFIAEAAKAQNYQSRKIVSFDTAHEAAKEVQKIIEEGDIVLIKASRGIGLEKVVDEIKAMS